MSVIRVPNHVQRTLEDRARRLVTRLVDAAPPLLEQEVIGLARELEEAWSEGYMEGRNDREDTK